MPSEDTKMVEFNQYQKFDKSPFIIYADLEYLIEKNDRCKNNPEISTIANVGEHIPSGFSMTTILSFKNIEIKHDVYRGKDVMKKYCESLREHTIEKINFEKKKMKSLATELQKSYQHVNFIYICTETFKDKHAKNKTNL